MGGGTSAGKTYGGLIGVLIHCATVAPPASNPVFSIISPTVPKIKQTTLRDWEQIRIAEPACVRINKTDRIYQLNGWTIEFVAFDDEGKARGPRRMHALIDEANLFQWGIIESLLDRTAGTTIFTYNPTNRFEVHDLIEQSASDVGIHFRLTFKDNKHVPEKTLRRILAWEHTNPRKWRVMGLGYLGKTEGLVYPDWNIGAFPESQNVQRYMWGMDFGYTVDPTAIVEIAVLGNNAHLKQHFYSPTPTTDLAIEAIRLAGMDSRIALACERDEVMVNAITKAGYRNAFKIDKPPGSIKSGIGLVKNYNLIVDPASPDLIKEFKSYGKKEIGTDLYSEDPIDADNHLMDAMRYAVMGYHNPPKTKKQKAGRLLTWKA